MNTIAVMPKTIAPNTKKMIDNVLSVLLTCKTGAPDSNRFLLALQTNYGGINPKFYFLLSTSPKDTAKTAVASRLDAVTSIMANGLEKGGWIEYVQDSGSKNAVLSFNSRMNFDKNDIPGLYEQCALFALDSLKKAGVHMINTDRGEMNINAVIEILDAKLADNVERKYSIIDSKISQSLTNKTEFYGYSYSQLLVSSIANERM